MLFSVSSDKGSNITSSPARCKVFPNLLERKCHRYHGRHTLRMKSVLEVPCSFHSSSFRWGLPWWLSSAVKNPLAKAEDTRDMVSVPGSGRSPGEGSVSPLHCSCLGNPMDRGAQWATVHGVAKSQTRLSMHSLRWTKSSIIWEELLFE